MTTLTPTQLAIVAEIGKALRQLGAGIGVQAAVGSWGDTLEEDEVLELLIHENSMDYYSQRRQELGREEFTNLMEKIFDEQGCGLPFAGYGIAESPAEFYTLAKLHGIKARHQRTNSLAGGPPGSQPGCATTPRTHKTKGAEFAAGAGAVPTMKYEK